MEENIKNMVKIGSTVIIKMDRDCQEYTISDSGMIDINKGIISSQSPIGKELIGRKKNDIIEVSLPENRKIKCEIFNIKN